MQNQNNAEGTGQMSLDQAFALAVQAHQSGDLENAKTIYRNILGVVPNEVNAMHFLGIALHQSGDTEEAIETIERSLALDPTPQADRYSNLSRVLLEAGRFEEASRVFSRVLELSPPNADIYNNSGVLLLAQRRFDEATADLEKSIALNPQHANAHYNMGEVLTMQGRLQECIPYYSKALAFQPTHIEAKKKLSFAHYALGELDKAAEIYRQWLLQEPDNPVARHHLAACTHESVPVRADDAYIESTFDDFADSFDSQLGHLNYQAPQLVTEAIRRVCGPANKQFAILDAGCGTGLCGPLIAEYSTHLTGVDLSSRMLAKAQPRNAYDVLIKAELTAYLQSQTNAFDLILSADTLIYFGSLEEVLTAARTALRDDGYLFFTVEVLTDNNSVGSTSDPGYHINPHGRYSHSETYLRNTLGKTGFEITALESVILRYEGGSPVFGFVVSCRTAAA